MEEGCFFWLFQMFVLSLFHITSEDEVTKIRTDYTHTQIKDKVKLENPETKAHCNCVCSLILIRFYCSEDILVCPHCFEGLFDLV